MRPFALLAATLLSLSGTSMAATSAERVISFDYGSLDTLDALNLGNQVVGVPKQGLPDYLSDYAGDDYADVGGLKSPDLDAIRQASPSLIVITGRQGEQREALEAIAPVMEMGVSGEDYLQAFDANVTTLAERFGAASQAASALDSLHRKIDDARQTIDASKNVLTVTHNDGHYMLNRHPIVYGVLGLNEPQIPENVTSETRGSRTFTPLTAEAIGEIDPDVILIVDRSAAIGSEAVDVEALQQALSDGAAADADVEVLTPKLWYLSGGGLQSLSLQIDDVVSAL
ncbi:ABC transporter substrate-binding protein [Halomonas sp. McH1-25]|uniref:ABC transporter substrate-binding protein n=1 Tax=unclassified Halomonas TaxID=2609666 RepID=UPI001EF4848F|nr:MULTISPECIES: ABC transporter substrate-binding protein [unclassified Halomonas]MCG7600094.1 ABC transporter substrate-binding protein [Halomonas sp. McH1-25]MCP1341343.1 ABC transporter substrate-binding protein [Halomonas sp. FL8]MCP1359712.1 ABC transporter substrate-binding protein [Halomonas sp. BBD45]MCP1365763.1 ABC transporter substrate-binding protein [Halomonas sp. BBD48]